MMKRNGLILGLVAAVALLQSAGTLWAQSSPTCPNPLPTCSTAGNLTDLNGTFVCTQVEATSQGQINTAVTSIISNGAGGITGTQASNSNTSGSTTFQDFSALNGGGAITYCLNTNDTGYVFPSGSGSCPLALVIDNGKTEVRLISTNENDASAIVCNKQ